MNKTVGILVGSFVAQVALAGQPLSYEDAVVSAVAHAPAVVQANLAREAARHSVTSANGAFDPTLVVDGGFNRSLSLERFGQFPDPFRLTSDGWNMGVNVSEVAPTGTTIAFDSRFASSSSKINLQDPNSTLAALFQDGSVQKAFRPSFQLSIGQELLKGVLMSYNLQGVRRARDGLTVAQLQAEASQQQAVADTSQAYWTWVQLVRTAEIAHRAVDVATESFRVGSARVDAGQAAPVERTRLEAALVQAKSDALSADDAAAQAADGLLRIMGESPDTEIVPGSAPGDAPPLHLDAEAVVTSALTGSLDLAVQRAAVETARRSLADARHAVWPSLRANVEGGLTGFDDTSWPGSFTMYESMFPNIGVGGTLTVPLGFRASLGASRQAETEVARQEALLSDAIAQLRIAVAQQLRVLTAAATRIELADVQVKLARETLASEEAMHDAGRSLLQDVLEARAAVDTAEASAVRARTDFRIAEVELRRLQGTLEVPGAGR